MITTRPSFREWQTTRLPEPYRTGCALRWLQRDAAEHTHRIADMLAPLRNLTTAFGALAPELQRAAEQVTRMGEALRRTPAQQRARWNR